MTEFQASKNRALTILEVLVTVTILMVLLAALLPVVKSVKQTAATAKCVGNLRSWGVAFQLYAAENRGFFPFGWINNSDHWCSFLAPYVSSEWLSYNPTNSAKRLDRSKCGCPALAKFKHPTDPLFAPFPYAYNAARFDYPFANPASSMKGTPEVPGGWKAGINWDPYGVAHRYNNITNAGTVANVPPTVLYTKPSQCVTMFCGAAATWRYMSTPYAFWLSGGGGSDWDIRTGDGLYTDENGISVYDYNAAPAGAHKHRGKEWYFHTGIGAWVQVPAGRDNYLFMDGHVETLDVTHPNLNRYVYNQIPNLNNPYR